MQPGMAQKLDRVPANQIAHLHLTHRWPQTRGEPWMHAVIRRLHDMQAYSDAEITAARAAACYMGFIKSPDPQFAPNEADPSAPPELQMEPGIVERLGAGEDFVAYTPTRPNAAMDSFIRLLVREIGSGADVPYEPLSGDYSQSNYSSSRLALIENREHWRHLQRWYIRSFREPLHRLWLQSAVYAGAVPAIDQTAYAINPRRFEACAFKPRGWSWVDPTKEVQAYADAVANGFMTVSQVIALTGNGVDFEDVLDERRRELDLAASKGIDLEIPRPGAAPTPEPANGN
jgi:lambda family phage portal protein